MADRYQDRPFPSGDDHDRGEPYAPARVESDPLAELARLIGQTDPFAGIGRANLPVQPRAGQRDQYEPPAPLEDGSPAGPPPWMQRATRQEAPPPQHYPEQDAEQDYPAAVHPLHRYAAAHPAPEQDYHSAPPFADAEHEQDPSRYDDALYGQLDSGAQHSAHDQAYADDPYGYQDGYGDDAEEQVRKRRGGMATVAVVLALAVVGTGAAFAYRTYVGSPRSGEPPIIKADTNPTKIMPAPSDGSGKVPDRMASSDGTEKIVTREEVPVDVNAKAGPRVVFPPLNQNGNQPPMASVGAPPPAPAGSGTLPSSEPRKIKTFSVRGDQPDGAALPVAPAPPPAAKPAPAARAAATTPAPRTPSSTANANANAPLSLSPQATAPALAAEPRTRIAANNPVQIAPQATPGAGSYLVQVSSQRNEAEAQASYRTLQGKFPGVLGSRAPVIKRADLGDKGVYYRAMVGPFGSPDEASQFCGSLKSAGGQCVVQRN
jgi:hypothetical protein